MSGRFVSDHVGKVSAAIASGKSARSALIASWERSARLHRLDPATCAAPQRLADSEFVRARQAIEPLLAAAQPSLDRLFQAVGGVGCSVLLADRHGIPVDRRGASSDDETFEAWGLWTGTLWSEEQEGTNGIGTCIVERRALTIHRDEHFHARNVLLSCTTAPIYDENGELAAALDVSSCRADLTEGFAQLIGMAVADAARRIEVENFSNAFAQARVVLAGGERDGNALLAVDQDDLVIGATRGARLAYGIDKAMLARRLPAVDLIGSNAMPLETLDGAERSVVQRALARASGNVSAAARNLGVSRATLHRKLNQLGLRGDG